MNKEEIYIFFIIKVILFINIAYHIYLEVDITIEYTQSVSIDVVKHEKGKRHSNNKETIWLELLLLYDLKMNNQVIDTTNI